VKVRARAVAIALGVLAARTDAHACGRGVSMGISGNDALLGLGILTVATTDIVFTAHDAARAGVSEVHDTGWAKAETYLTLPQLVLGGAILTSSPELAEPLAALSMWPASLMIHGFYTTNGDYGQRWKLPVYAITTMDVGLLGYWSVATIAGHRPSEWFSAGEFTAGAAQLIFGLSLASQSKDSPTRNGALMFSIVPAILVVHGAWFSKEATPAASTQPAAKKDVSVLPSVFVPTSAGAVPGFSLSGAF
jgi:hypothetical protein